MGAEWIGWKFVKRKMKVSQDGTSLEDMLITLKVAQSEAGSTSNESTTFTLIKSLKLF